MPQKLYVYNWKDLSMYPVDESVTGPNAIAQMMFNLINITPGEVLFHPEFGCDVESVLFEPMHKTTENRILYALIRCITRWDARLMVSRHLSEVIAYEDENRYDVKLVIKELSNPDQEHTFSFSLKYDE